MVRSINVLIVEDSANDAELLIRELRRAGYDPHWQRVETEQTFLTALKSNPNLVLSDFSMPRFDGLQAFKRLRETGRDIPFILVSGTVGEDIAVEAMRAGVTDYLLKDRLGRLGSAVDRAIQGASLRAQNRIAEQQRLQVEEALRWSESLLKILARAIQSASQGIIISDASQPGLPIIFANRGFETITGYSAASVLGRNCRFLQGHDTDPAAVNAIRSAIRDVRPITIELLNYRRDGTPFWNKNSITPVCDDSGRLTHFIGILSDVTETRSIEEQLRQSQKMDAIGRLAGGVAHDFNNLLAVIRSLAEMLLDGLVDSEPARTLIQNIQVTSVVGGDLTKQLLAFSRRKTGSPENLDLNAVVQETAQLLGPLIGNEINLEQSLETKLKPVYADRSQMLQVLINLAINARDAMNGRGRISIHTSNVMFTSPYSCHGCRLRPGEYVRLEFTDTGCGMTEDVQREIFEPLFTTKPIGQGTGLGLSTVYGIVKQYGGGMEVNSVVGTGTTFSIHLPVCSPRNQNPEHGGR